MLNYLQYFRRNEEGVLQNIAAMIAEETTFPVDYVREVVDAVANYLLTGLIKDPEVAKERIIEGTRRELMYRASLGK